MELSDPKLGTSVDGRYRLDERLAAGGMGVVYKGEQLGMGRAIAVKFLHEAFAGLPDLVKRFEREVAAMRRLRHPSLVNIIDSGVSAGVPYLVMDFHEGKLLSEVVDRGALPPSRAVAIARNVLEGVAHAHDHGVVHRDLKPDNILLAGEGDAVKILDFGLAKMVQGSGAGATQLTNTGFALGTPGYMAPEQAKGTHTDERADLYAVGVILYQMVVGRKPFVADSPMAVLRMHMDEAPMPPRKAAPEAKLSASLEAAILCALEKEPAKRWESAAAFARALAATPEGGGRQRTEPPGRGRRRSRRLAWFALATVALAAGAVGWQLLSRHDQRKVRQQVGSAVDTAKDAWHSLIAPEPKTTTPPAGTPPEAGARVAHDDEEDDGHDLVAAPRDTPGAQLERATPAPPAARKIPKLKDAERLLAAGKLDEAIQLLYQLRQKVAHSPEVALELGHAYFRKLWRTDGLREYDTAVALRPSLRHDRQMARNAVAALDDPTSKLARSVIRARLGSAALPELRRAAHGAKSPLVRKRAARLAEELAIASRARVRPRH